MKLLFKQRFSWIASYDVYDEAGNTVFFVKGQISWGHLLRIYDGQGRELGHIKQKLFTWLPTFEMYIGEQYVGCIQKEFSFKPKYKIDCRGWQVQGDVFGWNYGIFDPMGQCVATATQKLMNWTDTYVIEVGEPVDALNVLMLVLAIDAEKATRQNFSD